MIVSFFASIMSLSNFWETVKTGKTGVLQSMGLKESDLIEWLNNNSNDHSLRLHHDFLFVCSVWFVSFLDVMELETSTCILNHNSPCPNGSGKQSRNSASYGDILTIYLEFGDIATECIYTFT